MLMASASMSIKPIAPALLAWHEKAGRHDLPWQRERTPYRVWVSEVMLQQTQVAAVIPYFERFMQRFSTVQALADAPTDAVLHLWSGLGYYARARNLQRAAQTIRDQHAGQFPISFEEVAALPGIGRSTAGAILALARDEQHPIMDGNVRRVLSRLFAVAGRTGERAFENELWRLATLLTPKLRVAQYTQAIMDLGATICVRRQPLCERCPFIKRCAAKQQDAVLDFPAPKKPLKRKTREVWMLLARNSAGCVRLEKRPARGIWGGLWAAPEFASLAALKTNLAEMKFKSSFVPKPMQPLHHAFTHFDLVIHPVWVTLPRLAAARIADEPDALWYNAAKPSAVGLPTPIAQLLKKPPL
jgi:A/G-specific adenine glycosylase